MKYSFTPNREDYIKALRAFQLRQRWTWVFMVIAGVAVVCGLMLVILTQEISYFFTFPVILLVFFVIFLFFVNPITVGDQVEKNERLQSETTWEVSEEGVAISTPYAQSKFDWGTLGTVYETGDQFLLAYSANKRMFQILPKRAFESREQVDDFRSLAARKVGPVLKAPTVNLPSPSKRTTYVILIAVLVLMIACVAAVNFRGAMYG